MTVPFLTQYIAALERRQNTGKEEAGAGQGTSLGIEKRHASISSTLD